MLFVHLPVFGVVLAQVAGGDWSPTNVALVLWVIGQIAVQVINAIRGNPQIQQQNAQIAGIGSAVTSHDAQLTELAGKMLPPEVQAQLLHTVSQLALRAGVQSRLPVPASPAGQGKQSVTAVAVAET